MFILLFPEDLFPEYHQQHHCDHQGRQDKAGRAKHQQTYDGGYRGNECRKLTAPGRLELFNQDDNKQCCQGKIYSFRIKRDQSSDRSTNDAQGDPIDKDEHRINERIRGVKEVRLVGDNVTMGIYPIEEAMRIAEELELDLVEISATAVPPVCKVMDYQKFCYQQKKKAKEAKANAAKVVVKEIRFGPQTDDHDYEFKLRHAKEFLQEGSKVKAYVFFKGRSILFKEQGEVLLARFTQDLQDYGKPDNYPPTLEGKRMILIFSPKSGSQKKKEQAPKPEKKQPTVEIKGGKPEAQRDVTETNPLAAALKEAGLKGEE